MTVTYDNEEFKPPTLEALKYQAEIFFKDCKHKSYRQMKKDGTLDEVCMMRAKAATSYAEALIQSGTFAEQAWNMAIRQEILESESD